MRVLENITYDELQINDYATFTKTLSDENLVLFAAATGNLPVASLNIEAATKVVYDQEHGFASWAGTLISAAFDKVIPGPGSIFLEQDLSAKIKVERGDTLTVKLTVDKKLDNHRVLFHAEVKNQNGDIVVDGTAKVIAPVDKISCEAPPITNAIVK